MAYAHARIETADGDTYDRGDRVPASLDGLEELRKAGSVKDDPYEGDPVADALATARISELETELRELKSRGESGSAKDRSRR